jgi:HEAT repeat protein
MRIDGLFDVRLARLLPRRYEAESGLDTATVTRVLDILHEISAGPRLILLLNHLTHNSNQQIASKATMLIARRMQNNQAVENYLTSDDPRVRASTVEALWGIQTAFARRTMKACLQDPNNRVAGNALFGLFLLDDQSVTGLVERMLRDERPLFRATAAWVMGQIGKPEFRDSLQLALKDVELSVRQAARRALKTIHQAVLAAQPPAPEPAVAPPTVVPSPVAAPPAELVPVAAEGPPTAEAPVEILTEVAQEPASVPEPVTAPRAPAAAPEKPEKPPGPVDDGFEIHLDGSYIGSRRRR